MIEAKVFTGSIRHSGPIENQIAAALEESRQGGTDGAELRILGMSQSHAAGEQITVTVIYEYR